MVSSMKLNAVFASNTSFTVFKRLPPGKSAAVKSKKLTRIGSYCTDIGLSYWWGSPYFLVVLKIAKSLLLLSWSKIRAYAHSLGAFYYGRCITCLPSICSKPPCLSNKTILTLILGQCKQCFIVDHRSIVQSSRILFHVGAVALGWIAFNGLISITGIFEANLQFPLTLFKENLSALSCQKSWSAPLCLGYAPLSNDSRERWRVRLIALEVLAEYIAWGGDCSYVGYLVV